MVKVLSVAEVLDRQAKLLLVAQNSTTEEAVRSALTLGNVGTQSRKNRNRNRPQQQQQLSLSLTPPRRLFGGSGEPVVTSSLGGAIQPMRGNVRGAPLEPLFQTYMGEGPGQRSRQHREDEIVRLARWSRIAPPFSVGGDFFTVDDNNNTSNNNVGRNTFASVF